MKMLLLKQCNEYKSEQVLLNSDYIVSVVPTRDKNVCFVRTTTNGYNIEKPFEEFLTLLQKE